MEDSANNLNGQRQSLCCVSVPALNSWVNECLVTEKFQPLQCEKKRAHPDESSGSSETLFTQGTSVKRFCPYNQLDSRNSILNMELNVPLPEAQVKTCVVKVRSFQFYFINWPKFYLKVTEFNNGAPKTK